MAVAAKDVAPGPRDLMFKKSALKSSALGVIGKPPEIGSEIGSEIVGSQRPPPTGKPLEKVGGEAPTFSYRFPGRRGPFRSPKPTMSEPIP